MMLNPLYRQITLLLSCILLAASAHAQADTSFWFAAPDLERAHADGNVFLRISSGDAPAQVIISQPANGAVQPISITMAGTAV